LKALHRKGRHSVAAFKSNSERQMNSQVSKGSGGLWQNCVHQLHASNAHRHEDTTMDLPISRMTIIFLIFAIFALGFSAIVNDAPRKIHGGASMRCLPAASPFCPTSL
jgi:hypothetical protein